MEPLTKSYVNRCDSLNPVDENATLYQLFVDARDRGHVGEIVNLETNTRMTTNEILLKGEKYAKGLLAIGCVPGADTLAVVSCSSLEPICLYVAACSIGIGYAQPYIYHPKETSLSHILPQMEAKTVIIGDSEGGETLDVFMSMFEDEEQCNSQQLPLVKNVFYDNSRNEMSHQQKFIRGLDKLVELGEPVSEEQLEFARRQVKSEYTAFHVFTSGSTGKPKCVVLSNKALANGILTVGNLNLGNCLVANVAIDDTFSYSASSLALAGRLGKVVLIPLFDQHTLDRMIEPSIKAITEEKINILGTLAAINQLLFQHIKMNNLSLPPMKYVLYGGQVNTREFKQKHRAVFGGLPITMYGMSEAHGMGVSSVGNSVEDEESRLNSKLYIRTNMEIRIVNERDEILDIGKEGEFQIRSYSLFKEYKGMADKTREAFTIDGFFKTGDVAVMYPDSSFQIRGRTADGIRFKVLSDVVYPGPLETAMAKFPGVNNVAVVTAGVNDAWGDEISLCICLEQDVPELKHEKVMEHMTKNGAHEFSLPARILYFDKLPMTPNARKGFLGNHNSFGLSHSLDRVAEMNRAELRRQVKARAEEDPDAGLTSWFKKMLNDMTD